MRKNTIRYNSEATRRYIATSDDNDFWDSPFAFGPRRYSKGYLDDLRIYNRALSSSEISTIKNYSPPHMCINTMPESSVCVTCRGDRYKSGNNCVCAAGKWDNNSSTNCQSCNNDCATCTGSATNC